MSSEDVYLSNAGLAALNTEAQSLALKAVDIDLQSGLWPDIEGRPLSDIEIVFKRSLTHPSGAEAEHRALTVSPVNIEDANDMALDGVVECVMSPKIRTYEEVALLMGEVMLRPGFADKLVPNSEWSMTKYSRLMFGGRSDYHEFSFTTNLTRHVPWRRIEEARDFVSAAVDYVGHQDFALQALTRHRLGFERSYRLRMSDTLEIRGTEDHDFLDKYRNVLLDRLKVASANVINCGRGDAEYSSMIDEATAAFLNRAEQLQKQVNTIDQYIPHQESKQG